ncbi:MAG: hypothetical protein LUG18_15330 [Candidatus Azobacteroides sp.]|nr:hypothetical protein [Candidatus Azobacteroides sp.]
MLTVSKYKKLKSRYLNKNVKKLPFRSDLFNIEQLGEYAAILAKEQRVGGGTKSNYLLERLNDNDSKLQAFNHAALSIKKPQYISPATEWLVDNFYLIEEQIQLARRHFPKSYSRELPTLTDGPYKGLPRIYSMAVEIISHVDAQIDEESLKSFFRSYQNVSVLKLGELWAIPIMLRLVLIENLQRIATKLQQEQLDRNLANLWMDKIEKALPDKSSRLVEIVSDMAKANIPLSSAFVSEFSKRLSSQNPSLHIVKNWMEQRLRDEGLSSEELIHLENQQQASDQVSVSHSIKSLRFISSTNWKDFVESISVVEDILKKDPVGVYAGMDFFTRDHYRHAVENLAQQAGISEPEVAYQVVALAEKVPEKKPDKRYSHVGYYLVNEGIKKLKETLGIKKTFQSGLKDSFRSFPLSYYGGAIALLTLIGVCGFGYILLSLGIGFGNWKLWIMTCLFLVFISQFAVFLVNWLSTLLVKPDFLPRLDFSAGIPYESRAVVVIPTMISSEENIRKLLSDLEIHYLSNRDPNLYFALLTDFIDSDKQQEEKDAELMEAMRTGIEELNKKYCSVDYSLFYLFHRPRLWDAKEEKWMGYERKRGKLMAFNHFLRNGNTEAFSMTAGKIDVLQGLKYVITLDTDTQLPPYSAYKLIGTMAHILNRPILDPARNMVVKGYGIMQPRIAINLRSSQVSRFSKLFTDEVGIDPYTRYISDVYQDIFYEGSFVGKGIYDVDIFEQVLENRFPENKILSHDLLESTYIRSGLITDVEVYESYPSAYQVDIKRRHRWIRGDWQILQWLLPRVPLKKGTEKNPLSGLSKWKIADNLRRSLLSSSVILLLLGFLIWFPHYTWLILLFILGTMLLPLFFAFLVSVIRKPEEQCWLPHLKEAGDKAVHHLKQILFSIAVLPYDAWICADAIGHSLWRLFISHRNLLQWQTSEEADRTDRNSLNNSYRKMWFSPVFALVCLFFSIEYPNTLWYMLPFIVTWLLAPYISWYISCPVKSKIEQLTVQQKVFLNKIARKTWHFFEVFVSEKDNWLPPDNFQEIPNPVVASRTSPTNIGLSLLANLSACDFGYISVNEVIERTRRTFASLTRLKKFRGHLYNWYDTNTLEPLFPLYISTVDSGNLAGNLITLAQGLENYKHQPIYNPVIFEGLLTTVRVMSDIENSNPYLKELEKELAASSFPDTLHDAFTLLKMIRAKVEKINAGISPENKKLARWGNTLMLNCLDHMDNILYYYPWISKDYQPLLLELKKVLPEEEYNTIANTFRKLPTIQELMEYEHTVCPFLQKAADDVRNENNSFQKNKTNLFPDWLADFRKTAERAVERIKILDLLTLQSSQFAQMDFKFLYNEKKNLFTIGYNVIDQRFDSASYDILASEARLSSYIAIAQGQVPMDHWFSMSRLVIFEKGKPILLSWSGSMFEYLMPLLIMPTFEETLMDITYKGVIDEQIEYAKVYRVPWGISESGYNRTDMNFNYQYQAFGIPSLGLKRGLSKDLVIAPYASMLGLMVAPRRACENMERLSAEGHEGYFGYYEAIDYTPSHLPLNEKNVNIFSFMAHHQGMGLLSLVNVLKDNSMQKRFMSCPQMKAFELLLQERVPHSITANIISDDSKQEMEGIHALNSSRRNVNRTFYKLPDTPEVNLLSNGRYQVMVNSSGAGYSRWDNKAVTRWRKDVSSDSYGMFIYMKDLKSGKYWSAGYQPVLIPGKDYEVRFTQAYAEYRQRYSGLEIVTTVCVSPEDDVELRCVKVTNHTHKARKIEFTTFSEVVIAPQADDEAHTVFSDLFVQTKFDPAIPSLFCTRRPRSEEEKPPHLFHLMVVEDNRGGDISFETDRFRFIGRGNTAANPLAMQKSGALSGSQGSVLDPAIALRQNVTIPPGKSIRVCIALGIAEKEETAQELAEKY